MKQNDISDLPLLSNFRYENFFNLYTDEDGQYYYNLLRSVNIIPPSSDEIHDFYTARDKETWVLISWKYYKTIDLWWLICVYNQIQNPTIFPTNGQLLKLLKPQYVSMVIKEMVKQFNR